MPHFEPFLGTRVVIVNGFADFNGFILVFPFARLIVGFLMEGVSTQFPFFVMGVLPQFAAR